MATTSDYKIEVVSTHVSMLGEAPFWSEKQQRLIYVDCFPKQMCALDLKTKQSERRVVDVPALSPELDFISAVIPYATSGTGEENEFLVVAMNKLYKYSTATNEARLLYEMGSKHHTFNDGKCDIKGRLWVGNPKFDELSEIDIKNEEGKLVSLKTRKTLELLRFQTPPHFVYRNVALF